MLEKHEALKKSYFRRFKNFKTKIKGEIEKEKLELKQQIELEKKNLRRENELTSIINDYRLVLESFHIKFSKSDELELLDEYKNVSIKRKTLNLKEFVDKKISQIFSYLTPEIFQLLWASFFNIKENNWHQIKKNKVLIEKISIIIKNINNIPISEESIENIQYILLKMKKFSLNDLVNKILLLKKVNYLIEKISPFIKLFDLPKIKEKITEYLIKQNISNNEIEDIINFILIGLIKKLYSPFRFKVLKCLDFLEICRFFILKEFLINDFPEIYIKQCKFISSREDLSYILWQIYNSYYNYENFIQGFLNDNLTLKEFNEDKEWPLIEMFKHNLATGKVIIERDKLFAEYMKKSESKCDEFDYLFKELGEINYQYLHRAIFNKHIKYENLSKILLSNKKIMTFLLTYNEGITKYIDEILGTKTRNTEIIEVGENKKIIAKKYTKQARIGIITEGFNSIVEFKDYVFEKFTQLCFRKIINVKNAKGEKEKGIIESLKYHMEDAILEKRKYIKNIFDKKKKQLENEELTALEELKSEIFKEKYIITWNNPSNIFLNIYLIESDITH